MAMRTPEIRRRLNAALEKVEAEMRGNGDGLYARGLSREGYAGGYGQALSDIILLVGGHALPNTRNYWADVEPFGVRKTQQAVVARINSALERVKAEMRGYGDGKYARGLSSEGYAGGYAQALRDTLLLVGGHALPNTRNYWDEPPPVAAKTEHI